MNGDGVGCDPRSGSSGYAGSSGTRSCVISGSVGTWLHKQRVAHTALGIWRTVRPCLPRFPSLTSIRLVYLACSRAMRNPLNRPMRTRMSGGVARESGRPLPLCRFLVLTISPPLRFGPALCPAAEEALGRQVSEHQRDGSATIQAQIHHRQALLAPHRSVGFLGACAASCSCLQEEPPSSNPLAYRKSISHMPYGADIDRRSHKCSSRDRDRKISTPPQHRLRFVPFPDR